MSEEPVWVWISASLDSCSPDFIIGLLSYRIRKTPSHFDNFLPHPNFV